MQAGRGTRGCLGVRQGEPALEKGGGLVSRPWGAGSPLLGVWPMGHAGEAGTQYNHRQKLRLNQASKREVTGPFTHPRLHLGARPPTSVR